MQPPVERDPSARNTTSPPNSPRPRPWIGVRFTCAGVYLRVYRTPEATCYIAHCPKCGKSCRFPVGPGGTSNRLFDASCR